MPYADYYTSEAWYARRDAVKSRAGRLCEFCRLRPLQHVHHRSYAHFRHEPLVDLMGVCRACHKAIHGLHPWGAALWCARDSLGACGDSGIGSTPVWEAYLATFDYCPRCGRPKTFVYQYTREGKRVRVRDSGLCGTCRMLESLRASSACRSAAGSLS